MYILPELFHLGVDITIFRAILYKVPVEGVFMTFEFYMRRNLLQSVCFLLALLVSSCASVPPESVRLSRVMGEEPVAPQVSQSYLFASSTQRSF